MTGVVIKEAVLKIQTVKNFPIHLIDGGVNGRTAGQHIDALLEECRERGEHPNKLVLDLTPPPQEDPARIDD